MKNIICAFAIILIIPIFAKAAIQDIRVSNNTSAAVTISWVTDSDTTGEVQYSRNPDLSNSLTAYDTRGQAFKGCTHYVDIKSLTKETTYYFEVVSGDEVDNNRGSYYTFKTMKEPFAPPGTCLHYGYVYQEDGSTAAEGAIVYLWVTHNGVDSHPLSKLIGSQGSFLFTIKEARSTETDDLLPSITTGDPIRLKAVYCENRIADKDLTFERCTYNCGSIILVNSYPITTSSTTALTTVPTTIPPTTPTTIPNPPPPPPPPPSPTTSSTTTVESTTSSITTTTVEDAITSSTTSTVLTTSTSSTTTTVVTSLLWPLAYEELWAVDKEKNLSLLRSFRDDVMVKNDLGRDYLFLLYSNSIEIAVMLILDAPLLAEVRKVIDEILPGIGSLLEGKKITLSEEKIDHMESLLNHLEKKAVSLQLKNAIKEVRRDLKEGKLFKQFGVIGINLW